MKPIHITASEAELRKKLPDEESFHLLNRIKHQMYFKGLEDAHDCIDDGDGSLSSMDETTWRKICQKEISKLARSKLELPTFVPNWFKEDEE